MRANASSVRFMAPGGAHPSRSATTPATITQLPH